MYNRICLNDYELGTHYVDLLKRFYKSKKNNYDIVELNKEYSISISYSFKRDNIITMCCKKFKEQSKIYMEWYYPISILTEGIVYVYLESVNHKKYNSDTIDFDITKYETYDRKLLYGFMQALNTFLEENNL
jgi:hypothetical protein